MSYSILLIDYEPRTIARVTEALLPLDGQVVTAKDVDAAVGACAKTEPRVVIITSVLPRVKVEDAITQLRARAGLKNTPFLVLMSGYAGHDPAADAAHLGAQGIVTKPFSNEDLFAAVRDMAEAPRTQASVGTDSRAEVLEALRRGAGLSPNAKTLTSQELFGDLLSDKEPDAPAAATQRISVAGVVPPAAKSATPPAAAPPAPERPRPSALPPKPDAAVDKALESTLAGMMNQPARKKVADDTAGASVDALLSQTLSGLKMPVARRPEPKPAAPTPPPAAPPAEKPPAPPAKQVAPIPTPAPKPALAAPAAGKPLPGGTPFGQYELMELIATGGMAEVYKARMKGVEGFQKIVAIKRILPHLTDNDEFVTMFVDEAKLAAQLQHPNIIHIYDLGKIERSYYIAMEYIDGKDLRSLLRTLEEHHSRIPLGLALYIGSRLAAALDYAHRKHDLQGRAMVLVHRDVSPQNVLISVDGDIKLCDFGIAKAASKASHTRAGALKGKLQYMSPEQAWGKDIDLRSDIFSLGLVLYEMVTGRKAFAGDSELSILEQVRAPRLVPPRDVDPAIPPEIERVVMKALHEDRDQRYQTAAEVAADLDEIIPKLRPVPGASELGAFVTELVGRIRPAAAPAAQPARPAAASPAVSPSIPAPAAVPKPAVVIPAHPAPHPPAEVSKVIPPPRRSNVGLIAAGGTIVIAALVALVFINRDKTKPGAPPAGTPPPEAVEMARQIAQEEFAKQQAGAQAQPTAAAPSDAARPIAPTRAAAAPTPRGQAQVPPQGPAAQRQPAATPPAVEPTVAPAEPTAAPEVPTPAPEPTQVPEPTPVRAQAPPPAQAPATRPGDLVDDPDIPPQLISSPKPPYPPLAARRRVGGTVVLRALVDENGAVQGVEVLRGIKPDLGLDAAAANAVRAWRFKPATKDGVRVKTHYSVTVPFIP